MKTKDLTHICKTAKKNLHIHIGH